MYCLGKNRASEHENDINEEPTAAPAAKYAAAIPPKIAAFGTVASMFEYLENQMIVSSKLLGIIFELFSRPLPILTNSQRSLKHLFPLADDRPRRRRPSCRLLLCIPFPRYYLTRRESSTSNNRDFGRIDHVTKKIRFRLVKFLINFDNSTQRCRMELTVFSIVQCDQIFSFSCFGKNMPMKIVSCFHVFEKN